MATVTQYQYDTNGNIVNSEISNKPAYTATTLPSYTPQTDIIDKTYDAAKEYALAALEAAYAKNIAEQEKLKAGIPVQYDNQKNAETAAFQNSMAEYDAQRAQVPQIYQEQARQTAGRAAQNRLSFNEYAAATGLSSGAGGQAMLAHNNVLQANLNAINTNKSNALSAIDLEVSKARNEYNAKIKDIENAKASALAAAETTIANLKSEYQNSIAQAIKENEYARAEALYQEYQKAAQSIVDTALNQAAENYRAYQTTIALPTQTNSSGNALLSSPSASSGTTATQSGSYSTGSGVGASGNSVVTPTGNTYAVNNDGRAPSGLKQGDKVVTNGGTYIITAVNPDGTYKSALINNNLKLSNYTGEYAQAGNPDTVSGRVADAQTAPHLAPETTTASKAQASTASASMDSAAYTQLQRGIAQCIDSGDYVGAYQLLQDNKNNMTDAQFSNVYQQLQNAVRATQIPTNKPDTSGAAQSKAAILTTPSTAPEAKSSGVNINAAIIEHQKQQASGQAAAPPTVNTTNPNLPATPSTFNPLLDWSKLNETIAAQNRAKPKNK